MKPPYVSPVGVAASMWTVAVTNACPCAGTVTEEAENVTPSSPWSKPAPDHVLGQPVPVGKTAIPDVAVAVYVTGEEPLFVIARICDPPRPSPSAIRRGETVAVAATERSTCTRPAPCRNGDSRNPAAGAPLHNAGSALFESSVATCEGDLPAESRIAAAP